MTNDPDQFLRDLIASDTVGGVEGAVRLIEATRRGDRETVCALLDHAEHYALVDLVARLLVFGTTAAEQAVSMAGKLMIDALIDVRDHGGTIDQVIAIIGATETAMKRRNQ